MYSKLKNGKKTVGLKQTKKAIKEGKASEIFLAADADEFIYNIIKECCSQSEILIHTVPSMKELGEICEIDVPSAVAALLKD